MDIGFIFHIDDPNCIEVKGKMIELDTVDMDLLTLLGKNGRATGPEISKELSKIHVSLTDRAVLQRIAKIQEKKTIQGYTTILNPDIIAEKTSIVLLLKFKTSAKSSEIKKLNTYLSESTFCLSGKTRNSSRI